MNGVVDSVLLRPAIPLQWAKAIPDEPEGAHEIVEGLLTKGGMSIWYGESNSGKTTLIFDLCCRMSAGESWLGRRVEISTVLYVAAESPASIRLRMAAYRKHGGKVYGFGLIPCSLNLMDPSADVEDLIALIADLKHEIVRPVNLIVVDTLARVMGGANENASEDMSRLVSAGDRIREATGAHVAYVHHSGKDQAKGARGHSSLRAAVDTEIEVTCSDKSPIHTITITKQRDLASKGESMQARFVPVEVGVNQWGTPRTACVVEPVEQASAHLQALVDASAREAAESVVLSGFKRLQGMGVKPTDKANSPDYLPKQMLAKGLADGFDAKALAGAVDRLMTRGVFTRAVVDHYTNRTPKLGLVLGSEATA